ncbi:MAG TPA: hypothetical protein VHQ86_01735, partial [Candidatus Saccharimonadia bacterium]|nr:hypothetical protein [Candidatus Saccharimonadia bacterium]
MVNYTLISTNTKAGRAYISVLLVLVASPAVLLLTWGLVQRAQPSLSGLRFNNISWSAASDVFILTAVILIAAKGWKNHGAEIPAFFKGTKWFLIAYGIGLAAGIIFHLTGGPSVGFHDAASSWMHDLGVFPALGGAIAGTGIPLLFTSSGRWAGIVIAVLVIGVWGGLAVLDQIRWKLPQSNYWWSNPNWIAVPKMDW